MLDGIILELPKLISCYFYVINCLYIFNIQKIAYANIYFGSFVAVVCELVGNMNCQFFRLVFNILPCHDLLN